MIRNIKLLLLALTAVGCLSIGFGGSTHAYTLFGDPCAGNKGATVCEDSKSTTNPVYGPDGIVATVVNILSIIIGVAAVIVIIIAGIQYMLSTGDPTKVNNSKNAILYAVVGLIIAGAAQVIVQFVISKIG